MEDETDGWTQNFLLGLYDCTYCTVEVFFFETGILHMQNMGISWRSILAVTLLELTVPPKVCMRDTAIARLNCLFLRSIFVEYRCSLVEPANRKTETQRDTVTLDKIITHKDFPTVTLHLFGALTACRSRP